MLWPMKPLRPSSILFAISALLMGCDAQPPTPDRQGPAERQTASLALAEPPLDREAMIVAVARAASDWAAGSRGVQLQRGLDGRRFELRLRFGCPGEVLVSRKLAFDEEGRVLRAEVEPEISVETGLLADLGLDDFEAAEGFWVHRPWLLEAGCPAPERRAADGDVPLGEPIAERGTQPSASRPVIGIAQFYTEDDSRTARRESRAYEATIKLDEGEAPSPRGYDLVFSGRLARLPDGRVIACIGGSGSPPACVISVRFDHVALARPDGEILAQWSIG